MPDYLVFERLITARHYYKQPACVLSIKVLFGCVEVDKSFQTIRDETATRPTRRKQKQWLPGDYIHLLQFEQ
jgi:hypothetical protein